MKVSVNITGTERQFTCEFSLRTLVSVTVLSSLFFLVSSRSTQLPEENMARVYSARLNVQAQSNQLAQLQDETETRLNEIYTQLASLRAQLHGLTARSHSLADELGVERPDLAPFTPEPVLMLDDDPLVSELSHVKRLLQAKQAELDVLEHLIIGRRVANESDIAGRPVTEGWLSSYFGVRQDPFTGEPAEHKGLDFAGDVGSAVVATAAGVVSWAGQRWGYGLMVEVEHGDGWVTRYAHNGDVQVSIGDVVTKGQRIASIGNTGRSTGSHVHYEVLKNGQPINPLPFVYKKS